MDHPPWHRVFAQRKMAALTLLGLSSGLPFLLVGDTLKAWMTSAKVDLATIGFTSLVAIPYSLKFLWSPLVDRYCPPLLGRRRGWIALAQIGLAAAIGALAMADPREAVLGFAAIALAVAFLSATQDIAVDAYRADVLLPRETGVGVSVFVLGYRIALLATGSLALVLADHLSWPVVYQLLAALMLVGLAATAWAPEPARAATPPATLDAAVVEPFLDFFGRSGWRALAILAFVTLYKLGDSMAATMATPFLLERFSQADVGAIKGGVGLGATIVGTLAGGAILARIGINRALWAFGFLQVVSNLGYFLLAHVVAGEGVPTPGATSPSYPLMVACIVVENLCAGLGTAGFIAFLMSLCSPSFSATQYALLTSFMAFSRDILVSPAGALAKAQGWPAFFLITVAAGLPGLLLLPFFAPWRASDGDPVTAAR